MTATSADGWSALLRLFWHPVARVVDVDPVRRVVAARVLSTDLAIARLADGHWVAYADRCPHRSARLSVGAVDGDALQCAYHGWRYGADGACVEIPSMPGAPIPSAACTPAFRAEERHGLVWVLLDDRLDPPIPPCPMADEPSLRALTPEPYTWPVGAPRRVENFVDLAHFAFVHDGSLGSRDEPVPPLPEIERVGGELSFRYDPPEVDTEATAMFGASDYRVPMPLTVNIAFHMAGGVRRDLWMTASPVDLATTRCFWMMGRSDELDAAHDAEHLAFQQQVLDEDEPVVCSQNPPEMDLTPGVEISVRTDKVSIAYRRWLGELLAAVGPVGPDGVAPNDGVAALRASLGLSLRSGVAAAPSVPQPS